MKFGATPTGVYMHTNRRGCSGREQSIDITTVVVLCTNTSNSMVLCVRQRPFVKVSQFVMSAQTNRIQYAWLAKLEKTNGFSLESQNFCQFGTPPCRTRSYVFSTIGAYTSMDLNSQFSIPHSRSFASTTCAAHVHVVLYLMQLCQSLKEITWNVRYVPATFQTLLWFYTRVCHPLPPTPPPRRQISITVTFRNDCYQVL